MRNGLSIGHGRCPVLRPSVYLYKTYLFCHILQYTPQLKMEMWVLRSKFREHFQGKNAVNSGVGSPDLFRS